jgi:hypothetical protein
MQGRRRGHIVNASRPNVPLTVENLHERFTHITRILYDTSVPMDVVERDIFPYIASNVRFFDPLVDVTGSRIFRMGRRGFYCTFKFDFDIAQVGIQLNERGDGGRAMVDGIMNLKSLVVYTYPLRTVLVYDFTLTDDGRGLSITRIEEMWSFGDLFANLPLVGRVYDKARRGFGYFIAGMFWLSCTLQRMNDRT